MKDLYEKFIGDNLGWNLNSLPVLQLNNNVWASSPFILNTIRVNESYLMTSLHVEQEEGITGNRLKIHITNYSAILIRLLSRLLYSVLCIRHDTTRNEGIPSRIHVENVHLTVHHFAIMLAWYHSSMIDAFSIP